MWTGGVAAAVALGALHVAGRRGGTRAVAGALKPLPIALIAALVAAEPATVGDAYRWLVVAALLCSMVGDVFLLAPERFFVPGLASFLVAHVLYAAAFGRDAAWGPHGGLLVAPVAVAAAGILAYLWPHLGRDRVPVVVYVGVIAAMGSLAVLRAAAPATPEPSGALACAGAILFMTSDSLLAVNRFARPFAAAETALMTTYYAAQTLLALSVRA